MHSLCFLNRGSPLRSTPFESLRAGLATFCQASGLIARCCPREEFCLARQLRTLARVVGADVRGGNGLVNDAVVTAPVSVASVCSCSNTWFEQEQTEITEENRRIAAATMPLCSRSGAPTQARASLPCDLASHLRLSASICGKFPLRINLSAGVKPTRSQPNRKPAKIRRYFCTNPECSPEPILPFRRTVSTFPRSTDTLRPFRCQPRLRRRPRRRSKARSDPANGLAIPPSQPASPGPRKLRRLRCPPRPFLHDLLRGSAPSHGAAPWCA